MINKDIKQNERVWLFANGRQDRIGTRLIKKISTETLLVLFFESKVRRGGRQFIVSSRGKYETSRGRQADCGCAE